MFQSIKKYCDQLTEGIDSIPSDRKLLLDKIANYVSAKQKENRPANLIYICTHNSRRSQFGQIWANVACHYYNINWVKAFSGGTEATVFNINAINALKRIGFDIEEESEGNNPIYKVQLGNSLQPNECFSKVYDDPKNPQREFAAIMTCSDAEENCPFIPGVELRVGTTYDDPKEFDNTPLQNTKYDIRCYQIALETFYVFSKVN